MAPECKVSYVQSSSIISLSLLTLLMCSCNVLTENTDNSRWSVENPKYSKSVKDSALTEESSNYTTASRYWGLSVDNLSSPARVETGSKSAAASASRDENLSTWDYNLKRTLEADSQGVASVFEKTRGMTTRRRQGLTAEGTLLGNITLESTQKYPKYPVLEFNTIHSISSHGQTTERTRTGKAVIHRTPTDGIAIQTISTRANPNPVEFVTNRAVTKKHTSLEISIPLNTTYRNSTILIRHIRAYSRLLGKDYSKLKHSSIPENEQEKSTTTLRARITGDNRTEEEKCKDFFCFNNGKCKEDPVAPTGVSCQCPIGFFGFVCERVSPDCESFPCMNGGSCVTTKDGYKCECKDGLKGDICQIGIFTNNDKKMALIIIAYIVGGLLGLILFGVFCFLVEREKRLIFKSHSEAYMLGLQPVNISTLNLLLRVIIKYLVRCGKPPKVDEYKFTKTIDGKETGRQKTTIGRKLFGRGRSNTRQPSASSKPGSTAGSPLLGGPTPEPSPRPPNSQTVGPPKP